jgi:hypothetical protein
MTAVLKRIVEQVRKLSPEERNELKRLLSEGADPDEAVGAEQARLLGAIRQRRSFCPAEHELPESVVLLREDRGR